MNRYVISAPHSGLNWTRFCVEYFLGRPTSGKQSLLPNGPGIKSAFIRSHDPMMRTRWKNTRAFRGIDPSKTEGDKVALILRDPLETFVRRARGSFRRFRLYPGNIQFFNEAVATDKLVVYYDDIVKDSGKMAEFLTFLDIEPAEGYEPITPERLEREWKECGEKSRSLYDVNQRSNGGSITRNNPLDFKFHQKKLTEVQKHQVWRYLRKNLNDEEFALLDRYQMNEPVKPQSFSEKILGRP